MATTRLRYPTQLPSRMLPMDALFWYAEEATPELRPVVASIYLFDRVPDRSRFRASIERGIALVPRLRQRVVEAPWHYAFVPVTVGTPLSIALYSYGDAYTAGIDTDPAAIPEPQLLHTYLADALDELERCAFPKEPALRASPPRPRKARKVHGVKEAAAV
jgi:hypothetical protein